MAARGCTGGNDCDCSACRHEFKCKCGSTIGPFADRRSRTASLQSHATTCLALALLLQASALRQHAPISSLKRTCSMNNECNCRACCSATSCSKCGKALGPFASRKSRLTTLRKHKCKLLKTIKKKWSKPAAASTSSEGILAWTRKRFLCNMARQLVRKAGAHVTRKLPLRQLLRDATVADTTLRQWGVGGGDGSFVRYLALCRLQSLGFASGMLLVIGDGAIETAWQIIGRRPSPFGCQPGSIWSV